MATHSLGVPCFAWLVSCTTTPESKREGGLPALGLLARHASTKEPAGGHPQGLDDSGLVGNAPVEASAEAAAGPAEELDGRQEPAALRLQSWVRMCQCCQHYCQMCNIACILRAPKSCFAFQNHEVLQAQYESAVKHLGFHVKILSI